MASAVVCVPESSQLYVYAGVPPVTNTVANPSHIPKQEASLNEEILMVGAPRSFTIAISITVQPKASVTVIL